MASGGENTDRESSSSETEEFEDPNDSPDDELNKRLSTSLTISEPQNGEWLPDHSWNVNKPDPNLKMIATVAMSSTYPLSQQWIKKVKTSKQYRTLYVDLAKIFSCLPRFVQCEMRGSINGGRQELEWLVHRDFEIESPVRELNPSDLPPHTREIVDGINQDHGNDEKSLPKDRHLKATSIEYSETCHTTEEHMFYFDCEYTLKMFANCRQQVLTWFDVRQRNDKTGQTQCIREKWFRWKEERWIFIPSFRRASIALLEWPQDDIVTQESTIRILVVRPSEFEEYVRHCGYRFPIICLPQDEIGAGYARYWIQKIAQRLKLQFIWMIDDSVECFYEYHPFDHPPFREEGKGKLVRNYRDYRRRPFGLVLKRIEEFVKEADHNEKPIAAMSPRRWNPTCRPKKPFSCKPPQGAVFLNLRALSEKNVYYRPELKTLEDMIFGYECEQKGLKVYRDNRILLQDHKWKDTGASSPSVNATTCSSSVSNEMSKEIKPNKSNECGLM